MAILASDVLLSTQVGQGASDVLLYANASGGSAFTVTLTETTTVTDTLTRSLGSVRLVVDIVMSVDSVSWVVISGRPPINLVLRVGPLVEGWTALPLVEGWNAQRLVETFALAPLVEGFGFGRLVEVVTDFPSTDLVVLAGPLAETWVVGAIIETWAAQELAETWAVGPLVGRWALPASADPSWAPIPVSI